MAKHKGQIVWSPEAEKDLLTIWFYGADEWSPATADAHLHLIFRSCSRLLDNPELGRARDEVMRGLRSIVVEPHVVFYRSSEGRIEIIRVLHGREDVENSFSA